MSSSSTLFLNAIEERVADFMREIDAIKEENRVVNADYRELLLRYRLMEEELSKQTCMNKNMEEDIVRLTEKENWLQGRVQCLETDFFNLDRAKKEELNRVSKAKMVLEAKLQEVEVQLAKQQSSICIVDMKNATNDFEHAVGQEGTSDKLKVERHGKMVEASEVTQTEKKELKCGDCNVKKGKSNEIWRVSNKKMSVEAERRYIKEKDKMKNQELTRRVQALEKEKGQIEVEMRRTKNAKSGEIKKILNEKMALETQYRRIEEEMKEKNLQLANRCMVMEDELCNTLHERIVSKDKISELVSRIKVLEAELCKVNQDNKSEIEKIMNEKMAIERRTLEGCIKTLEWGKRQSQISNKEKTSLIKKMISERTDMEAEKMTLQAELRKLKGRQQLINKICKEKMTLQVELKKLKEDKKDESERFSTLEEALSDQKSRMQAAENRFLETLKMIKEEMGALEAQVREKSEEIMRILKEKSDLEVEKRIMEEEDKNNLLKLIKRVDVMSRENTEMEAKLCQAKLDKNEENKKILDLAKRIDLLVREMQGLEAEIMDKDEVIKVVVEENTFFENMIKKLNIELSNLSAIKLNKAKELQLSQPFGMLSTASQTQGEGKKNVVACKRKRTNVSQCKQKRHFSEGSSRRCEVEDDASKKRKADNIWEVEEDVLDALDNSPELCLKAICALYKQHLLSVAAHPVFKPCSSSKAVVLSKYLVDDDPETRLKKTVADVEQFDPLIVVECRDIAKQHYKELFEMYNKSKHDPSFYSFFLSTQDV